MDNIKIPTLEEIQQALKDLMYGKMEHEGARLTISLTLYTQKQVDAIVELVGGWENFAILIGDRHIQLSITYDGLDKSVGKYVDEQLSLVKENVQVAQFKPIKNKTDAENNSSSGS